MTECAILDVSCWDMQYHEGKTVAEVCDMAAAEASDPAAEVERGGEESETNKVPQETTTTATDAAVSGALSAIASKGVAMIVVTVCSFLTLW